jgi:hypothetical protein
MKKRFLLPLIAIAAPLGIGIADAAIHMAGCGIGHQGACQELASRKLYGQEDNITDAKRCIKSDGVDFEVCNRVNAEYIPEDLKATFAAADKKGSVLAAKQKEEQEKARKERWAKINAETKAKNERDRAEREARGEWVYNSYTDDATGKTAKRGILTSKNTMNFGFPYSGTQHGSFVIRNHPRYGVDAYLTITKGQLLCSTYSNPTVLVRFDNGAASSYNCNSPADHSSDTVFIEGVGRLEGRMKTAKKMYVTVSVHGEGSRTWEFNVKGYDRSRI